MTAGIAQAADFVQSCTISTIQLPDYHTTSASIRSVTYKVGPRVLDKNHFISDLRAIGSLVKPTDVNAILVIDPSNEATSILKQAQCTVLHDSTIKSTQYHECLRGSSSDPHILATVTDFLQCAEAWFECALLKKYKGVRFGPMRWIVLSQTASFASATSLPARLMVSLHVKVCPTGKFMLLPKFDLTDWISVQDLLDFGINLMSLVHARVYMAPDGTLGTLSENYLLSVHTSPRPPKVLVQTTISCPADKADDMPRTRHCPTNLCFTQYPIPQIVSLPSWQPLLPPHLPHYLQWQFFQDPVSVALWWLDANPKGVAGVTPGNIHGDTTSNNAMRSDLHACDDVAIVSAVTTRGRDTALANSVYPTPPDGLVNAVAASSDVAMDATPSRLGSFHNSGTSSPNERRSSQVDLSARREPLTPYDKVTPTKDNDTGDAFHAAGLSGTQDLIDAKSSFAGVAGHVISPELAEDQHSQSKTFDALVIATSPVQSVSGALTPPLSPVAVKARLTQLGSPSIRRASDLDRKFSAISFRDDVESSMTKYTRIGKFGVNDVSEHIASAKRTLKRTRDTTGDEEAALYISRGNPSDTKRRKISLHTAKEPVPSSESNSDGDDEIENDGDRAEITPRCASKYLPHAQLSRSKQTSDNQAEPDVEASGSINDFDGEATIRSPSPATESARADLWDMFNLTAIDFIESAQMVAEQYRFGGFLTSTKHAGDSDRWSALALQSLTNGLLDPYAGRLSEYDLTGFASLSQGILSAAKETSGLSRPVPRRSAVVNTTGSLSTNHLYMLPSPWVRLCRADGEWEVLPTAVECWETLSLEPLSHAKNIKSIIVAAGNKDFSVAARDYVCALGAKYDSCRLGTHAFLSIPRQDLDQVDGVASIHPKFTHTAKETLAALLEACMSLHILLDEYEAAEGEAFLLYLIDPFERKEMLPFLCACLWNTTAAHSAALSKRLHLCIIPSSTIVSYARFEASETTITNDTLALLARSIYDILPSQTVQEQEKHWQMGDSSCIRLASPPPRKINFSLQASPPINLLQEANVLHVAYRISGDQQWLSVAWTDQTGGHQDAKQFCLHETDAFAVLESARDWTQTLLSEGVTWRVIIAKVGSMSDHELKVWTTLVGTLTAVTLIDVSVPSSVPVCASLAGLSGTSTDEEVTSPTQSTVPTPGTSPLKTSPVDSSAALPESASPAAPDAGLDMTALDPETQTIDLTDETWAMILPFSATNVTDVYKPKAVLASGMLIKRGRQDDVDQSKDRLLPSLGIDINKDMAPLSSAKTEKSWLSPRSPEGVLREVLIWYRALALLAKIRGLRGAEQGNVPWHVAAAMNGAEALEGFFGPLTI